MKIKNLSWQEVEEINKSEKIAILPVGSLENHGPQSPLGTDFIIPEYLANRIDSEDILIFPTVPYGICPHHEDFPGTINLGYDIFYSLIYKILTGITSHGFKKILVINGHGGNSPAIERAALEINSQKESLIAIIDWWSLAGELNPKFKGGHAGGQETSAILYIDKDLVKLDRLFEQKITKMSDNLKYRNISVLDFKGGAIKIPKKVSEIVKTGWFGPDDPADSTYEYGEEMLEMVVDYLKDFLKEFHDING